MDPAGHVAAVRREAAALADALRATAPSTPVPTCPEWSLRDLAVHAGLFAAFWDHVLCESTGRPRAEVPEAPDGPAAAVGGWFASRAGGLVERLVAVPPATEVWTWAPDDATAGFVARRAAHELAVHRVDAELAAGAAAPVEPALAADGIDEVFWMIEQWRRQGDGDRGGVGGGGEALHLHATDVDRHWVVRLEPAALVVEDRAGPADLALTGTASDLEMVLYQRPTVGEVAREGDVSALAAWRRTFRFA